MNIVASLNEEIENAVLAFAYSFFCRKKRGGGQALKNID